MQVDLKDITSVKKEIKVTIPKDTVDHEFEQAYKSLQKKAKVKGFRPGKAPTNILKQQFGEQVKKEVAEKIFNETYSDALKKADVNPIDYPDVNTEGASEYQDFIYNATIEVIPEITIEGYRDLEVEKEKLDISKKDVEQAIQNIANSHATLNTLEKTRPIKKGDYALIDFETFSGGEPIDEGKSDDFLLEVGKGSHGFGEEFSNKLIGKMPEDDHEFELNFPDDHPNNLFSGKDVLFKVKIKEVKEKTLPKIDDEFAKDLGEFETLKELKEDIKVRFTENRTKQIEQEFKNRIIQRLIDINEFEIPKSMVYRRSISILQDYETNLKRQGLSLESAGVNIEELLSSATPRAEFDVRTQLILEEIARSNNIEATKEEAEEAMKKDTQELGLQYEVIKERYDKDDSWGSVIQSTLLEKTLDFLTKVVKIKEVKEIKKGGAKGGVVGGGRE